MKIRVEIDCTPEEARSFLGLPDLGPMQDAITAKIQEQMLDVVSKLTPAAMQSLVALDAVGRHSRRTAEKAAQANEENARQTSRKASRPSAEERE